MTILTPLSIETNKWGGTYRVKFGVMPHKYLPVYDVSGHITEKKWQHYTLLEASIKREGIRNPVLWMEPPSWKQIPYGGSRCYVAQKLGLDLPMFVCDYTNDPRFDTWEDILCIRQVLDKFVDPPSYIEFTPERFEFWGCSQSQYEDDSLARTYFDTMQHKNDALHDSHATDRAAYYYAERGIWYEDGAHHGNGES